MKHNKAFRIEQKERVINNRKKLKKDTKLILKHEDQDGRFAKKHPYDCGKAGCQICHSHKNMGNSLKRADVKLLIEDIKKHFHDDE